jgi:hypothetical protein
MPPERKEAQENVMILVGQLIEAAKATSDGIKALSEEVRSNAKAVITAAATLQSLEEQTDRLEKIVCSPNDDHSLVERTAEHRRQIESIREVIAELRPTVRLMQTTIDTLVHKDRTKDVVLKTTGETAKVVGIVIAWLITTAVAIYAALKGN